MAQNNPKTAAEIQEALNDLAVAATYGIATKDPDAWVINRLLECLTWVLGRAEEDDEGFVGMLKAAHDLRLHYQQKAAAMQKAARN